MLTLKVQMVSAQKVADQDPTFVMDRSSVDIGLLNKSADPLSINVDFPSSDCVCSACTMYLIRIHIQAVVHREIISFRMVVICAT